jgi:hypothetical protein
MVTFQEYQAIPEIERPVRVSDDQYFALFGVGAIKVKELDAMYRKITLERIECGYSDSQIALLEEDAFAAVGEPEGRE